MNTILQKRIDEAADAYSQGKPYSYEQGFLQGCEWLLKNQWISVEEALPECDKCHLAMYEDGGIIVAKYKNETWWWQDGYVVGRNTDGDFMYSSSCKVPSSLITHWMSIPQIGGEE